MRSALVLLGLLLALAPAPARAECEARTGERAILVSNSYDPDVLVWDSIQRLLDYEAGGWRVARTLLPHALLARAGTRAIVVSCHSDVVHPKYQLAPADAAGIRVTSGPYKGRYGWIMAADLRVRR